MKPGGRSFMKILAIEFSSPQRSVAVLQAGQGATPSGAGSLRGRHSVSEVVELGGRSMDLLGMIEEALRQAQVERNHIEALAIGIGPGSYTGIRAAIAIAQGWQLAGGTRLVGISSAECIAAQAQREDLSGLVEVVVDAQREEFYLAGYELTPESRREVEPLRLAGLAEVRKRIEAGEAIVGPEVRKWFPAGRTVFPRAAALAELAVGRANFVPGEKLEPIYLRETKFVKAAPPRILPD
jgi:tRNA threonylcarbamoyladenosine biosynthesis protein TsaB